MSGSNRITRRRRLSQDRDEAEEGYDHTSSSSSAEAARRTAEEDARTSRSEQEDADAIQLEQEEADAIDAARFAAEEADTVQLAEEEADAAYAASLALEEANAAQKLELQRRRNIIRDTAGTGQFLPASLPLLNPSNNLNPITSTTSSTPVEVDRQPGTINRIDQVTNSRAGSFLLLRYCVSNLRLIS
jgi:hypothetical protein